MLSEIPIGQKYVVTGTVTCDPHRAGTGHSARTAFQLTDDTGTSLWISAYEHDFPRKDLVGLTAGDRIQVTGHAFHCVSVLDEIHATSITSDTE